MKKVVLSLTLALLTGASLLAGCASQTQEPEHNPQDEVVISISSEPDTPWTPARPGPRHHPPVQKHPGGI
ncbi:MAG: hypothetical protein ACLU9S_13370 [Oscillospiraceae bacterium]